MIKFVFTTAQLAIAEYEALKRGDEAEALRLRAMRWDQGFEAIVNTATTGRRPRKLRRQSPLHPTEDTR
jgi:hypothetical protein